MMQCPRCSQQYTNEAPYIPRILIACGHTVCEFCILEMADKRENSKRSGSSRRQDNAARLSFECPDCKSHNQGPNL